MSSVRNTPLTARSVLASVLLGTDPPWLPTPSLVRTTALFGIAEGTTRTALSRMVGAGEAVAENGGYRLVGSLVVRQARQSESRLATTRSWDGRWELATIDGDTRRPPAARAELRQAMVALRLAELRESVWGRPDNLAPDRSGDATEVVDRWCVRWRGALPHIAPGLGSLWDLRGWASAAGNLRRDMTGLTSPLDRGDTRALAAGFITSAAVLRLLQSDPLLPDDLLPRGWPGADLRAQYDAYDATYRAVLRSWLRAPA